MSTSLGVYRPVCASVRTRTGPGVVVGTILISIVPEISKYRDKKKPRSGFPERGVLCGFTRFPKQLFFCFESFYDFSEDLERSLEDAQVLRTELTAVIIREQSVRHLK